MSRKIRFQAIKTFALLTSLHGLNGCSLDTPLAEMKPSPPLTREERLLKLAPPHALRPESDPWGGAITQGAGGKLLSAALHDDNALGVWLIDPNRTIREVAQVQVGYHPDAVAALAEDIVAVAVEGAGKISFWRLHTSSAPQSLGEITTPFPTREIVAHDLDDDGQKDLILAPYKGTEVAILWGEGNLRFSAPQKLGAALIPWHPKITDWNGDGHPDLIWSDWDTGSVRLYLNQGQRKFALTMLQPPQPGAPRQLAVGDVDQDGRPDAVMAMSTGKVARILFNRGDRPVEVVDVQAPSFGFVSAEVMKDGTLVLGEERRVFLVRRQQEGWTYRALPAGSLPAPLLLNDLDHDGHEDLIIFHSARGGTTITWGPLWERAQPFTLPAPDKS